VTPHQPHVEEEIDGPGDVQPDEIGEENQGRRRASHREHHAQLLAAGERLGGMLPHRLHHDAGAVRDHHDGQPEGKETALGTVGPPAESQPHGVEEDDRTEEHQEGCGGDVGGAHPVT